LSNDMFALVLADTLRKCLWPQAQYWFIEVGNGYADAIIDTGASKEGLATFLAPCWTKLVTQSRVVLENRARTSLSLEACLMDRW
jgi:hypothetical protein